MSSPEKITYPPVPFRSDEPGSYAQRVAAVLSVDPAQVAKSLVVSCQGQLVLVVAPGDAEVSLKSVAHDVGVKKARMATAEEVARATGFKPGGVSPIPRGRRPLPTYLDQSLLRFEEIIVSAGKPGAAYRIAPESLISLTNAQTGDFRRC